MCRGRVAGWSGNSGGSLSESLIGARTNRMNRPGQPQAHPDERDRHFERVEKVLYWVRRTRAAKLAPDRFLTPIDYLINLNMQYRSHRRALAGVRIAVDLVELRPNSTQCLQRPVKAARGPRHRQVGQFHDRPSRCLQWRASQRRRTTERHLRPARWSLVTLDRTYPSRTGSHCSNQPRDPDRHLSTMTGQNGQFEPPTLD